MGTPLSNVAAVTERAFTIDSWLVDTSEIRRQIERADSTVPRGQIHGIYGALGILQDIAFTMFHKRSVLLVRPDHVERLILVALGRLRKGGVTGLPPDEARRNGGKDR